MAILVVGGKGFIGSQVIRRLLARGEAERLQHPVYNVGGHTISYRELAALGTKIIPGLQVEYAHQALPIELPFFIDNTRIAQELGVVHRDLESAFRELAAFSREEAGLTPLE